jgi:outer membrane protein OmpA-like peptidoglycan-associated protein
VAATTASVAALLAREPEGDADRDGVANQKDDCPLAPGPSGAACHEGHRVDLENGRIELLKPIRFEEGSDALDARGEKQLDEIAATLRANARMKILVESHVAAESAPQPGLALSTKRASAARKALLARGIAPERIKAYGCGENRPIAPNNVPWGRKKNERLEVHLLDPAPTTGVHSTEGCSASE